MSIQINQLNPDTVGGGGSFVNKDGDTMNGNLVIDRKDGTTSSVGYSVLQIGNNISSGTANNSRGFIELYSSGSALTRLRGNATQTRVIDFPNAEGTLALTSDVVSKSGDTMTGRLTITDQNSTVPISAQSVNTTTESVPSELVLGNSTANGTVGCTHGTITLWGKSNRRVTISGENISSTNKTIQLPNASGTLALTSDVDAKVSKDGDTMTGALTIKAALAVNRADATQATFARDNSGTSSLSSIVYIGNNIADGTAGCSDGQIRIYGNGSNYTTIEAPNSTASRKLTAPDASGTVTLDENKGNYIKSVSTSGTTATSDLSSYEGHFALFTVKVDNNNYYWIQSYDIIGLCNFVSGYGIGGNTSYTELNFVAQYSSSSHKYSLKRVMRGGSDVTANAVLTVYIL